MVPDTSFRPCSYHFVIAAWRTKEADSRHMKTNTQSLLLSLLLIHFAALFGARAVSPPPDGAYPNFTTAEGQSALQSLTTGEANTALGAYSMFSTSTASFNTAVGAGALDLNATGDSNTAVGTAALLLNTTGTENAAIGTAALEFNDTGRQNTANGAFALFSNTIGQFNTADGDGALDHNTTGISNTAIGTSALSSSTTGNSNIAVGVNAGGNVITASNVICIGSNLSAADASDICFIGNIRGVTTINNNAIPVLIDSAGQLGTTSSSRRFKHDIKPMDKASEAILALKPVSFRYKVHKDRTPQFGLIAEDVAAVNPDLVIYDADSKPYTVRYEAVNAMLLNEFLKEHRKVQELEANAAQQQRNFAAQQKQVEALTIGLQKVSAELEVSKSAPQTVLNNQ